MRISGINIPDDKQIFIALTAVYGIGVPRANGILKDLLINKVTKAKDLTQEQESEIRKRVESFLIEGDLRRNVTRNIKRLKDIQTLRGLRHSKGLPVRGQRTRTNARTRKGPKKTMGSGRIKLQKK